MRVDVAGGVGVEPAPVALDRVADRLRVRGEDEGVEVADVARERELRLDRRPVARVVGGLVRRPAAAGHHAGRRGAGQQLLARQAAHPPTLRRRGAVRRFRRPRSQRPWDQSATTVACGHLNTAARGRDRDGREAQAQPPWVRSRPSGTRQQQRSPGAVGSGGPGPAAAYHGRAGCCPAMRTAAAPVRCAASAATSTTTRPTRPPTRSSPSSARCSRTPIEIGLPYIGTASRPGQRYGETVDGYRRAAEDFNRFGAAARARGMRSPPPPLRGVRRRERRPPRRRPARGDRPQAGLLRVRDLLVARRPDALPGLQAVRVPVEHAASASRSSTSRTGSTQLTKKINLDPDHGLKHGGWRLVAIRIHVRNGKPGARVRVDDVLVRPARSSALRTARGASRSSRTPRSPRP